jgi:hypothetical protein
MDAPGERDHTVAGGTSMIQWFWQGPNEFIEFIRARDNMIRMGRLVTALCTGKV